VVHLTRWAAGDATLRDPARVDEASIAAGVVLARWFGDEARRVYAILGESDEGRASRRLVEWIARKGGTVTVRDLTRGPCEYRGDPERAAKALDELVAAGVAVWVHDDHGPNWGRPADRVWLVSRRGDTGDGDETPANAENCVGSGTVATVLTPTNAGQVGGAPRAPLLQLSPASYPPQSAPAACTSAIVSAQTGLRFLSSHGWYMSAMAQLTESENLTEPIKWRVGGV
jgi:hypothetical protein